MMSGNVRLHLAAGTIGSQQTILFLHGNEMTSTDPLPFEHPTTLEKVQSIVDRGLTESIHLEFKASAALMSEKTGEISKDISSFANSDGGTIIYGIVEKDHKPAFIDDGVEHRKRTREWLEDTIQSNVSPRLDGLRITQVPISDERSVFVVSVPRSDPGPHQDRVSYRYFKRHNFKSAPMEDYEIRDVRNRRVVLPPLISIRVDVVRGALLQFCVENVGDVAAADLKFLFTPEVVWQHGPPPALTNGVKSLLPGKKLSFMYGSGPQLFEAESKLVREFAVDVSYFHLGAQKSITDRFDIDLTSLEHTLQEQTELELHAQKIDAVLGKLVTETKAIGQQVAHIGRISDPTGLALSFSTVRTLGRLFGVEPQFDLLDPRLCAWQAFQEVLGVDARMATNLSYLFNGYQGEKKLAELDGMTTELLALIQKHFRVDQSLLHS